jgi:RimJ/RimL family protein N-acetyltransferase
MTTQAGDLHVPMLGGSLVYLRPAERTDIPLFVRWLSDARTTRNLALRSPLGVALEEQWFDDLLQHHGRDRWHFVICLLSDGRPVGSLDLHAIDYTSGGAGLGIQVGDAADRSKGYGADALGVLLDFAFDQLRLERVWLDVYASNPDARRLYERVGFVHEATFRHGVFRGGRYDDVDRLAILRSEWAERRAAPERRAPAGR